MSQQVTKTWDDARLKRDRVRQIQAEMKRRGIGALYLDDGVHVRYMLGVKLPGGGAFVPPEGEVIGFVRPRDVGYVKLIHSNIQPPIYNHSETRDSTDPKEGQHFAAGITELMAAHGVKDAPLGVDALGPGGMLALVNAGIKVTEAAPAVERAWTVKTEDEVAIYKLIGQQYATAVTKFREALRPGITENELAGIVVSAWYEAGGEDIAQLNVCAGEDMNPWRRWPTQRPVQSGEFVGVDLHGRGIHGLRGDASRTFFVGDSPTAEQKDMYRQAYDYLLQSMSEFRAGRTFDDVVATAAPRVPEKYRPQQYNLNVGHGASMGSSGYPHLDPRKKTQTDDVLRPNQLISVECFFGEVGSRQAVKLEEMIVVQDGAPEQLAQLPFDERFV